MCNVIGCNNQDSTPWCDSCRNKFENNRLIDLAWTCNHSGCNNPTMLTEYNCEQHGGMTASLAVLEQCLEIFRNLRANKLSERATSLFLLDRLAVQKRAPTQTEIDHFLNAFGKNNNIPKMEVTMSKLSTLKSEAREMAIRKTAEKLLKTSRKQAPKILCKAGIITPQYEALASAFLETPLGESVWNIILTSLATYAPELPVSAKFQGIQARIASEMRIQTMGSGVDQIWNMFEPFIEGFFSDFEKEEQRYAGLVGETTHVKVPDLASQEEHEVVSVSSSKAKRSQR